MQKKIFNDFKILFKSAFRWQVRERTLEGLLFWVGGISFAINILFLLLEKQDLGGTEFCCMNVSEQTL